ncbi:hypothetical protein J6590_003709 [Homalodisca vitripennis]|nr:hypothetical protein J6590_003709 [Homalodisca vitripennis]
MKDEFGQMILHFAMARTHGRNAVFQLLQEVDCNIALRDELYRTPRDVAVQVNISENVEAIDKYVVSLAAIGELDKLRELLVEGYDHILDARDDNSTVTEVANERNQTATLTFLDSINSFEDKRERLHRAIRLASDSQVQEMLRSNPGLALAKNQYSRCSLHIAVLNQHDSIVQHIAQKYPQTLVVGDNPLGRDYRGHFDVRAFLPSVAIQPFTDIVVGEMAFNVEQKVKCCARAIGFGNITKAIRQFQEDMILRIEGTGTLDLKIELDKALCLLDNVPAAPVAAPPLPPHHNHDRQI